MRKGRCYYKEKGRKLQHTHAKESCDSDGGYLAVLLEEEDLNPLQRIVTSAEV